jgi:hypothetical protein
MPKFEVGDAVVHLDSPDAGGRITEIRRSEDPVEYEVRWSGTRVLALVAESALLPGPDDLDERELEHEAGSLE